MFKVIALIIFVVCCFILVLDPFHLFDEVDFTEASINKFKKTRNPKYLKDVISYDEDEKYYNTLLDERKYVENPTEYSQFVNALIFYLESTFNNKARTRTLVDLKHRELMKAYSNLNSHGDNGKQLVDLTQKALDEVRKEKAELKK